MTAPASLPLLAPIAAVITLLQLGAGATAAAWLVDVLGRAGRGFRGTTSLICAVIVAVALLVSGSLPDPQRVLAGGGSGALASGIHWTVALLVALLIDALFAAVGTDAARVVVGGLTSAIALVALVVMGLAVQPLSAPVAAVTTVVAGALLCGTALSGMLLGHWYLIAPDLTFRPLRIAVYMVFAAVVIDAAAVVGGVSAGTPAARTAVTSGGDAVLFWVLVVGSGLVFTAAVNALTLFFARMRANQPATAMLYVLIISALMGVVPASLVFLQTGVAL